jgi:hypothetical protein
MLAELGLWPDPLATFCALHGLEPTALADLSSDVVAAARAADTTFDTALQAATEAAQMRGEILDLFATVRRSVDAQLELITQLANYPKLPER